jgi:hypothetical protein
VLVTEDLLFSFVLIDNVAFKSFISAWSSSNAEISIILICYTLYSFEQSPNL